MMTIKEALFTFLQNQPSISAFVGGTGVSPATVPRIYPLVIRQDNPQPPAGAVLPCLNYHIVAGHSEIDIGGNRCKTGYARIQLGAWTYDRFEAARMIEALRVLLAGYIGSMGDITVQVVHFAYTADMYDHISKVSHSSCQITMFFKEA